MVVVPCRNTAVEIEQQGWDRIFWRSLEESDAFKFISALEA
jgi:hypothetical protein